MVHSKGMGRELCTNKAPVVNERTKQQRTSGISRGEAGKHEIRTERKTKSQIRWSPWQMQRASGTVGALRVAFHV